MTIRTTSRGEPGNMSTESYARHIITHCWGARCDDVAPAEQETPDFLAYFPDCKVLIEEKTKTEDPARAAKRQENLARGDVYETSDTIIRNNRLSGIVKKAASQLQSAAHLEHDLRVAWITSTGPNAQAKFHQCIATLYGSADIVEMGQSGRTRCYFFENSDFHRFSHTMDGAVVAYVAQGQISLRLCINPLSSRAATLSNSFLAGVLIKGLVDPAAEECNGKAFVLDGEVDRRDEDACLAWLQMKYGTGSLMRMNLGYNTAYISP